MRLSLVCGPLPNRGWGGTQSPLTALWICMRSLTGLYTEGIRARHTSSQRLVVCRCRAPMGDSGRSPRFLVEWCGTQWGRTAPRATAAEPRLLQRGSSTLCCCLCHLWGASQGPYDFCGTVLSTMSGTCLEHWLTVLGVWKGQLCGRIQPRRHYPDFEGRYSLIRSPGLLCSQRPKGRWGTWA